MSNGENFQADLAWLLEQGFDVQAFFLGMFTVDAELFKGDGEIGDEYCWMHEPGGWCCKQCREKE